MAQRERTADTQNIVYRHVVRIPVEGKSLEGDLRLPEQANGLVLFAHGSGSGRLSPRNRYVAQVLNEHHMGTLLSDLLTIEEETVDKQTHRYRFDIPLLSDRLERTVLWADKYRETRDLPIGIFGASTGAAAALITASRQSRLIKAVASRGGRPDLAMDALPFVKVPVLLIVGARDPEVLQLNKKALAKMDDNARLDAVPHATHLFEEPGTLESASQLAGQWFEQYLGNSKEKRNKRRKWM